MRIDDKCLRIFVELRAFPSGPVNDHRNVHFYPLAATVFRQSVCIGWFLAVHKTTSHAADLNVQSKRETKNWLQGLFKDRSDPLYRQFSPKSRDPFDVPALLASRQPSSSELKQDQQRGLGFEVRFGTNPLVR
jgi:hypothetical protein